MSFCCSFVFLLLLFFFYKWKRLKTQVALDRRALRRKKGSIVFLTERMCCATYFYCFVSYKLPDAIKPRRLCIKGDLVTWIRPTTLEELLELRAKYPQAKLVIGNTEIGNRPKKLWLMLGLTNWKNSHDAVYLFFKNVKSFYSGRIEIKKCHEHRFNGQAARKFRYSTKT